ncbi:UDP-glucuronosyl/UDP-glucosyltransferase [Corchorus capsularis]|uniref:UDP-glucuronosyl/UDP-glucosyltransferase n=1 Tax=Corchorus capsularis TaxID=210143 RepID=A0A1R3IK32_COCAP|nr:UDP-glucuronosyl/UDP-glucosyltransferase [Corchorus capsularis]
METLESEKTSICHVVAMPYPGRGHINPMMNFCKLLCSKLPDILITFVVTEEWFGFIGSDNKPVNIQFRTIPNVIPSELVRAKDFPRFVQAVLTKMEAPFEELLDRLELPVTAIVSDTYVGWTVEVGKRRNIPVASFWTMSASVLSVFHHFNLLVENQHFPADLSDKGNELVDYIPGLTPTHLADLPTIILHGNDSKTLQFTLNCISTVPKAQYLLFTCVYELEFQVIDAFKAKLPFPVYPIGPSIPYIDLKQKYPSHVPDYFEWLDSQPEGSVLYVSLGSFLSVSAAQMDEIVAGVQDSGVRYLWVTRGDSSRFDCGGRGVVIPWSDQLRYFPGMDPIDMKPNSTITHLVAIPYPGRGHINPMMNLCKLLSSRKNDLLITFIVTEEWLGFIGSCVKPDNIHFAAIPNVLPSELVRGADFAGFYESVMTKMEAPCEKLLDSLELPVTAIIADIELKWAICMGSRRNFPMASLCTTSATVFSILNSIDFTENWHFLVDLLDKGISPSHLAELQMLLKGNERRVIQLTLECISWVPKAKYLLLSSVYELESNAIDTLKAKFDIPIYPIGPAIPYFDESTISNVPNYLQWLNSHPPCSVLYVSLGSYLSVSNDQMDEIAAGLQDSGVPYMLVARGENSRLRENYGGMGLVVPWCDQLKVLCHCSIGGFLTHCGWNSTLEAVFAGIPMLTFPLTFDQGPNSKKVVDDWKIGWRVKEQERDEGLVTRARISELVRSFMDPENSEVKNMRKSARELKESCRKAVASGGSSRMNLDAFLDDISQCHGC